MNGLKSQESRIKSQEARVEKQELRTYSVEYLTEGLERVANNREAGDINTESVCYEIALVNRNAGSTNLNEDGYSYRKWGIKGGCKYNWKGKKILIIDTNELNCRMLSIFLKSTQVNMELLYDTTKIKEYCCFLGEFDLILLEVYLIGLNGYNILKKIRLIYPETPIIVQTVLALPEHEKVCYKLGCNEFVTKPINYQRLMEIIDGILGLKS